MKIPTILSSVFISFCTAVFADFCPFCQQAIVDNQSVFESESFHVLVDYKPRVKGHLLVIPKRHVVKAHELSEKEWCELSMIIPKVIRVFETYLGTNQYVILEKMVQKLSKRFHMFIFTSFPSKIKHGEMYLKLNLRV